MFNAVNVEGEEYPITQFDIATGTTAFELMTDMNDAYNNGMIPYGNPFVYKDVMCQLMQTAK